MSVPPEIITTNAPLSEMRVAKAVRTYERIKLAMLAVVLVLSIASTSYLISLATTNKKTLDNGTQTLVILRCAVDPLTSQDEHGVDRTDAESRKAFTRCVAAHKE